MLRSSFYLSFELVVGVVVAWSLAGNSYVELLAGLILLSAWLDFVEWGFSGLGPKHRNTLLYRSIVKSVICTGISAPWVWGLFQ